MEQAVSAKRVNQEAVSFGSSRWTRIRRELKKNRLLAIGLILVIALVATVLAAPLLTSWNPNDVDLSKRLLLPGQEGHLLGTDGFGRDLFARILYGGQNSLALAVLIVLTNAVIGMIIGAFSAYSGGLIDAAIMRLVDLLMSFPSRIMTIFIVGVFGPSLKCLF